MNNLPMLADFAVRLAFGLAALLVMTSWRTVPLAFFRTHCQVILGLLVLASLDGMRASGLGTGGWLLVAGAVLAYVATVGWGLGLPRIGLPATAMIVLIAGFWLVDGSRSADGGLWMLNASSRLLSGYLLGATLTAMLLGHHYLTAPAMSIEPLKQSIRGIGWGLGARGIVAGLALLLAGGGFLGPGSEALTSNSPLFMIMRWGMGFAGPALATWLAWKTAQIRSTQSATGILYVALTLVLFGELTSLILARSGGVIA